MLRTLREPLDVSQGELAFRAKLRRAYVSGVERGVRNPTVLILGCLAEALKVDPAKLPAQSSDRDANV